MAINKDELELIERASNGSESDFETLILSCKGKAYNIAYRYLNNEEDALDALQESFVKVYKYLRMFKGESSFSTWVYRIVANTCCDILRKQKARLQTESIFRTDGDSEYMVEVRDDGKGPEDLLLDQERNLFIIDCLEKLPVDQKEIIILRDIQGFSYEEIADILVASMGTVKSRLSRARLKLREIYLENLEQI